MSPSVCWALTPAALVRVRCDCDVTTVPDRTFPSPFDGLLVLLVHAPLQ